jgi:signal transduction histidine kinase
MGLVTGLTRNPFFSTRIRITAIYVATSMLIVVFFSTAIYAVTARNIRIGKPPRNQINEIQIENIATKGDFIRIRQMPGGRDFENIVRKQMLKDIKENIIVIDIIILFIVTILGYVLSGYALLPIKRTYEKQKRFIEDASHDLKTPLSVIHSDLELAIHAPPKEKNDFLQSAITETNHMTKIVNDLAILAKSDSGFHLKKDASISSILNAIAIPYKQITQDKGLGFETNIEDTNVLAHSHYLARAIRNILDNAVEYTSSGSITVIGFNYAGGYKIIIKDTGIGINKEDLQNIFERFYRAEKSRTNNTHSGLGLAIAKNIIENHGGKIEIESTVGQGTEVKITL